MFRNPLAETVYNQKYSHDGLYSWQKLSDVLIDDITGTRGGRLEPLLSKEDRAALADNHRKMKFVAGGRYLYYAGRPMLAINNCFGKEVRVLTTQGWRQVSQLGEAEIISPVDGKPKKANFVSRGVQQLYRYEFSQIRGKSKKTYSVRATKNHKWLLSDGSCTEDLQIGQVVPAGSVNLSSSAEGFLHGFIFGDGNKTGVVRLCGMKRNLLPRFLHLGRVTSPPFAKGDLVFQAARKDVAWKELPSTEDPSYIGSFIEGWLAADGHDDRIIHSTHRSHLEWFVNHAAFAGYVITGELRSQTRDVSSFPGYKYKDHTIWMVSFSRGETFRGFKLINKEPLAQEEVFCPFEPEFNQIIIDHNIRTYQCYLFKGQEDTREEWGSLLKRISDSLMTGGGVGIDYSVFRPKGAKLARTGGLASGPIPLMHSVNEVGRNVMQGGSRRSAIYASLNWQHGDVSDFLKAKNWGDMPIGKAKKEDGSLYTYKDAKEGNFNFPAPLDMTNISLNYDDAWLDLPDRHLHPTFLENTLQALRTAEPGWSFNFREKQEETLRNAPVAGKTRVLTRSGYQKVEDILNQKIEVWTGVRWAKTTFKLTKENTRTIKVIITGGREIECDPTHEFILARGEVRVPAMELKKGDELLVSLPVDSKTPFSPKDYTLGFMFGDGHFRVAGGGEISFFTDDKKKCLERMDRDAFSSIRTQERNGSIRAYVKTGWTPSFDKDKFPEGKSFLSPSFVAGLFDSDGSYDDKQRRIRVSSVHREFLEDLRRYLESLGILSGVSSGGISQFGKTQTWTLTVMSEYLSRFAEVIPTARIQPNRLHNPFRKSKLKVLEVCEAQEQNVYCCDVGVKEHSFQAEGVIISNCTEVTSEDDSDVCNLASVNMSQIDTIEEFAEVVYLASKFLYCGTIRGDVPFEKVRKIRDQNRRLGLGLMGIHEWLLKRKYPYEVVPELHQWLEAYRRESERGANEVADAFGLPRPKAYRAIAPTGSIGLIAKQLAA